MPLIPPLLSAGDKVLIIGTARARNREAIQPSIEIIKSWGFDVETGPNLFQVYHQFAGTDNERAADLQWAIDHPQAKAIVIAGGGYGALRIIDKVDFSKIKANPKWLIGYSDTTIIHSRLLSLGIAAIHGTMAFQFNKDVVATESIKNLLIGKAVNYEIPPHKLNRLGMVKAELVGGNLSLLYALSGSEDDLQTKGKILFLEDLDEQLYHLDRMMLQLKRSGKLKDLSGLIIGGMTEMKDNAVPFGKTPEEIIYDAIKEYSYPVCFNFPAGHIERNMAFFLGKETSLNVGSEKIYFS